MDQVLSQDELLEPILEFAGKELKDLLNLRAVCHRWKELAFKIFINTKQLVETQLCDCSHIVEHLKTNCFIPLKIRHDGLMLTFNEIKFLQDYGPNIAAISFGGILYDNPKKSRIPIPNYNWNLSNLQELEVTLPEDHVYYNRNHSICKLIAVIQKNATRLSRFKVSLDIYTEEVEIYGNLLPHGVTHLQLSFNSDPNNLETLFSINNWEYLKDLELYLGITDCDEDDYSSNVISHIVNKLGGQLSRVKIEQLLSDKLSLKIGKCEAIKELNLSRVHLVSQEKNKTLSMLLPNLKTLKLEGNVAVLTDLEKLFRSPCEVQSLNEFIVRMDHESDEKVVDSVGSVMLQLLQCCTKLRTLRWDYLSPKMAASVMPFVFSKMTTLTCLDIKINKFDDVLEPVSTENVNIDWILTGLTKNQIAADETQWSTILDGKVNTLTNLKSLREFSFQTDKIHCHFGLFFMRAVLHKLPRLETLGLIGDTVQVDKALFGQLKLESASVESSDGGELPNIANLRIE